MAGAFKLDHFQPVEPILFPFLPPFLSLFPPFLSLLTADGPVEACNLGVLPGVGSILDTVAKDTEDTGVSVSLS